MREGLVSHFKATDTDHRFSLYILYMFAYVLRPKTVRMVNTLRKHAYSNILKIWPQKKKKKWKFSDKNSDIFHISAQNIDCGYALEPPRWGGSNTYPQSMFLSRNKKNNVYPC